MNIKFLQNGSIEIDTSDYVPERFGHDVSKVVSTPATHGLYSFDNDSPALGADDHDLYHSIVGTLLWVMKQGRPDIETPISFLRSRTYSTRLEKT